MIYCRLSEESDILFFLSSKGFQIYAAKTRLPDGVTPPPVILNKGPSALHESLMARQKFLMGVKREPIDIPGNGQWFQFGEAEAALSCILELRVAGFRIAQSLIDKLETFTMDQSFKVA